MDKFILLTSGIDLSMVTIDSQLIILAANEKFRNLYKVKEKEELPKSKLAQLAALSIQQNKGMSGVVIYETELESPSYFMIYSSPSNDEKEYFQTIVLCDISSIYQYFESKIEDENRKLIGDIAAGTADIIFNPLTAIKGSLQMIEQRVKSLSMVTPDEIQTIETCLSLANEEANHIHRHVQRLLQLGKPFDMELVPVSLSTIFQELIPSVQQEALNRNCRFVCEFPQKEAQLFVHPLYLKEVLLELITNSFEALSGEGKLAIAADIFDQEILFRITDYGGGVPDDIKKQIQRPFFTTKDNSIGLGLSFCDIVLQKMGGRMEIRSTNCETIVCVFLPIVRFYE